MKTTTRILALLLALLTALSVLAMAGCSGNGEENKSAEKNESTKTEKKFSEFYGTDWINAEEFGFKGDGKTPNDDKFAEYIEYYDYIPLYFPAGVYCFEKTLNFPDDMFVRMDPDAELKCIAKEPLEFFITLRGQLADVENCWANGIMGYAWQAGIEGGRINCNYKAKCALTVFQGLQAMYRDLLIMNVLEKGIQTLNAVTPDGCSTFENIWIFNTESLPNTYGIYDNHADNHFLYITVVNFETSFYTRGGRFVECSGWNNDMKNIENATFAEIHGVQSLWIGPSVDTVRYGFKIMEGASTSISDLVYITNLNMYSTELQAQYPRTLFWAEDPEQAKIMATGIQIRWEEHLAFSNAELPMSTFLNVRLPDGCDGPNTFKNFRDDSAYLREWIVEAERDKGTFTATGKTDFNTLTEPGVYECNLIAGKGGANLPPAKEKGMMTVWETNGKILQTFYGDTVTAHRTFNGAKWGEWIVISQ